MRLVKAYVGTGVPFLLIDAIWIGAVVGSYYRSTVGHLLAETPNFAAAGLFYVAYVAGVVFLAVNPALDKRSLKMALVHGATVGALAYGTFTLTNFAVFSGWTLGLVISDIAWGTFLTAVSAAGGYWFASR
ncbi:MAG: DUF2177 family protein [Gammaproteobacteria bacterium]|nr:DUF2177 family protein [Gammaproteobacteria bacterium]